MKISEFSQYRLALSERLWSYLLSYLWSYSFDSSRYRLKSRSWHCLHDRIAHKLTEVYEDETY